MIPRQQAGRPLPACQRRARRPQVNIPAAVPLPDPEDGPQESRQDSLERELWLRNGPAGSNLGSLARLTLPDYRL